MSRNKRLGTPLLACILLALVCGHTLAHEPPVVNTKLRGPAAHSPVGNLQVADSGKELQRFREVRRSVAQVTVDEAPVAVGRPATKPFNAEDFTLSDLVENLDSGNHFRFPPKAQAFLRRALASGPDFKFETHNRKGTYAYISSDLSPNIWINPSEPRERIGQAICHEMLHYQDMQQFKPINRLRYSRLNANQTKVFHPVVRDLVNMISHEHVKKGLEKFDYARPLADTTESRLKRLAFGITALERTFVSISKQLSKAPGRRNSLKIVSLQPLYQNLMLMVLRDQLLFKGAYTGEVDALIARLQAILDFMHQSASEDPRFNKVYQDIMKPAQAIRASCKKFQASGKTTEQRYALLRDTLSQIYEHVGISFELVSTPPSGTSLKAISSAFEPGQSFLLDGSVLFSDVKVFVPYSKEAETKDPAVQLQSQ